MTDCVAFLRGVNLGRRKVLAADLVQCFAVMGFAGARPLLASGNVLFEADPDPELASGIEAGLKRHFGFEIGTVLRTRSDLQTMIAAKPFGSLAEDDDTKLYVTLLRDPLPETVELPSVLGDYDVTRRDAREVYVIAHRLANGRYGEGMLKLHKILDRATLATTRNWNTIIKAAR